MHHMGLSASQALERDFDPDVMQITAAGYAIFAQ
jgi:hypothetical protein